MSRYPRPGLLSILMEVSSALAAEARQRRQPGHVELRQRIAGAIEALEQRVGRNVEARQLVLAVGRAVVAAVKLRQIRIGAHVEARHAGLAHVENQEVRILAHIDALHIGGIDRQLHQIRAFRGVGPAQRGDAPHLRRPQGGIVAEIKRLVERPQQAHVENSEIRLVGSEHQRRHVEGIVADIQGLELGHMAEVEALQQVVVKVQDRHLGQSRKG